MITTSQHDTHHQRLLKRLLGMAATAAACLLLTMQAAAGGQATDQLKATIDEMIRVLSDKELKKPDRAEERRKVLEKIIGERFSYEEMSKRALGAQWNKLDDAKRKEFVSLFQRHLSNAYAGKIEGYKGEQVHFLNERLEDPYAEVRSKIVTEKVEIPLDYRLVNKSGDWRVYDVVVDGVSLVNNYRGQFSRIIRSSSYEDLVERLRKKSEDLKAP
jgi:phospholipid transport system substrate-binding protein